MKGRKGAAAAAIAAAAFLAASALLSFDSSSPLDEEEETLGWDPRSLLPPPFPADPPPGPGRWERELKQRRLTPGLDGEHALRIAHVVNLYAPLDDDRRLVLESMELAKNNGECVGEDLVVEHVAAIHPGDADVVPASFDGSYPLSRYYEGRYPLLQDIFDGALGGYDFDFMIFTNSDIVLHPHFYCTVRDIILLEGRDAFAINRKTVPHDTTLDEIQSGKVRNPARHPGHDCWVLSRDVWSRFKFGTTFLGYPRFSRELLLNMLHFGEHPRVYESFDTVNGTYHRGDDRGWEIKKAADPVRHAEIERHITNNVAASLCGDNNYHVICDHPKNGLIKHWCWGLRGFETFHVRTWCARDRKRLTSFKM